jgi:hypothetical protein
VFDRQIRKNKTQVLRRGVVSCLKVFYKKSFLKQYNKAGLVLRLEVCVEDPRDFRIDKSLVHPDYWASSRITR